MKTFRFFAMLMMVVMATTFVSCSDDDDEDAPQNPGEFTLVGTSWTYTDRFDIDGVEYVESYSMTFSQSTVNYVLTIKITDGTQVSTQSDRVHYDYTYNKGLVVFKPTTAGKAYLEGEVISESKMIVTNVSSGDEIGTFYKD